MLVCLAICNDLSRWTVSKLKGNRFFERKDQNKAFGQIEDVLLFVEKTCKIALVIHFEDQIEQVGIKRDRLIDKLS